MPQNRNYNFRARDTHNRVITGVIQAATLEDAAKLLVKNGMAPIAVTVPKTVLESIPFFGKVNRKQVTLFCRQLATMLDAGLTLSQALRLLVEQAGNNRFREVVEGVLADVQEGFTFSSALGKRPEVFDSIFVNAVRAGESTGKLDVVLRQLADTMEQEQKVGGKIRGAMVYPAFILLAMVGVAVLMLTQVIPQLKSVFDQAGASLPIQTTILLSLSDIFVRYWSIILFAVVLLAIAGSYYLKSEKGKAFSSSLVLKVPVASGIAERSAMASFGRLMSMLLSSGVPLLDSLRLVEQGLSNRVYKNAVREVSASVERGIAMSDPISKNPLFPAMLGQMVAVGEQTGKMDEVMERMAVYYETEVQNQVAALATLIEPFTIVLLGIGVAWLVMAILLPIYQISSLQ